MEGLTYLESYENLGLKFIPIDKDRNPLLSFGKTRYYSGYIRASDKVKNFDAKGVSHAAVICGPNNCGTHASKDKSICRDDGKCNSGIIVVDFDKLKDKNDKETQFCGAKAFEILVENEFNRIKEDYSQLPFPLLQTRSGGYHAWFRYDREIKCGNNTAKTDVLFFNKTPLIDVKGTHMLATIPLNEESNYKWIVPPWDQKFLDNDYPNIQTFPSLYKLLKKATMQDEVEDKEEESKVESYIKAHPLPKISVDTLIDVISELPQETIDDGHCYQCISFSIASTFREEGKPAFSQLWGLYSLDHSTRQSSAWKSFLKSTEGKPPSLGGLIYVLKTRAPHLLSKLNLGSWRLPRIDNEKGNSNLLFRGPESQATYIAAQLKDKLYYIPLVKKWIVWDTETYLWLFSSKEEMITYVSRFAKARVTEYINALDKEKEEDSEKKASDKKYLLTLRNQYEKKKVIDELLAFMAPILRNEEVYAKLNNTPDLVALPGKSVVELRTQKIRLRTPEDFFSKTLMVSPRPWRKCKEFKEFIQRIFPDKEKRDHFRKVCGSFLTGEFVKLFFIFLGPRHTLKSTIIDMMDKVLGDYSRPIGDESLLFGKSSKVSGGNGHSQTLCNLNGARMSSFTETNEKKVLNTDNIKRYISGEPITASMKYGGEVKFTITTKFVVTTNNIPSYDAGSSGVQERLKIIEFTNVVEPDESKRDAIMKLIPEMLSWMIEGAFDFYSCNRNFDNDPFEKVKDEAMKDQDILTSFLGDEGFILNSKDKTLSISSNLLWMMFKAYTKSRGNNLYTDKRLKKELLAKGYEWKHTNKGNVYLGIAESP